MDNELLKQIIIDYFGVPESDFYFNDSCNFHMNLGDAIQIAEIYGEKIRDQYPLI